MLLRGVFRISIYAIPSKCINVDEHFLHLAVCAACVSEKESKAGTWIEYGMFGVAFPLYFPLFSAFSLKLRARQRGYTPRTSNNQ